MEKDQIKVATISMCSTDDRDKNIATAIDYVKKAANSGADWILLPEIFAFNGRYEDYYKNAETEGSPLLEQLSEICAELNIVLFAGTLGERTSTLPKLTDKFSHNKYQKVYNTLWVLGRDGKPIGKYRKTHLFNLFNHDGTPSYCESDIFLPGESLLSICVDGWKIGLSICYDLRFSGIYQKLQDEGKIDAFVVPSAFTKTTGEAHWELFLRARAVEFQCYMIAANQVGENESKPGRETYGHSSIIDPWGIKLCDTAEEEGIAFAEISKGRIAEIRSKLPALSNRRPELY